MNIGAQLYGFEKPYALNNLPHILKSIKEMGYDSVEMPFMTEAVSNVDQYTLNYFALHVGIDELTQLPSLINHLQKNNCHNLCISGPLGWHDRTISNFEKSCIFLNDKARLLKAKGINVHYHNHDFEFIGTQLPIDILLKNLDPSLIKFCIDVGWMHVSGTDPVSFLNQYKDSISYVHLRDFSAQQSVPLGEGSVNISGIIGAIKSNPSIEWLMVEHEPEQQKIAFENLSRSRAFLKDCFGL
jgi:sugar phosphate isomerase/epimerase